MERVGLLLIISVKRFRQLGTSSANDFAVSLCTDLISASPAACLPGSTLAGRWSQELDPGSEQRHSSMGCRCCNQPLSHHSECPLYLSSVNYICHSQKFHLCIVVDEMLLKCHVIDLDIVSLVADVNVTCFPDYWHPICFILV